MSELIGFSDLRLNAYLNETITWDGDARYKQQLLAIVNKQQARFRRAVASLQQSGQLLTVTEAATLQPRLEIVILDYRSNRSGALPLVSDRDVSALVRTTFSKPLS